MSFDTTAENRYEKFTRQIMAILFKANERAVETIVGKGENAGKWKSAFKLSQSKFLSR